MINNHIIRSTRLDLYYNGPENAFELQKHAEECLRDLIPEIDKVMNDVDQAGKTISIDLLELDITLSSNNWKQELVRQLRKMLSDRLNKIIVPEEENIAVRILSSAKRTEATLLFYLKQGFLPWNVEQSRINEWKSDVHRLFDRKASTDFFVTLMQLLKSDTAARLRLIREISFDVLLSFLKLNADLMSEISGNFINDIRKIYHSFQTYSGSDIEEEDLQQVLLGLITGEPQSKSKLYTLLKQKVQLPGYESHGADQKIKQSFSKELLKIDFTSSLFMAIQESIRKQLSGEKEPYENPQILTELPALDTEIIEPENVPPLTAKNLIDSYLQELNQYDGIFIPNAGLIILAPFLPMLFRNLGISSDEKKMEISKAVCTAGFLATGNPELHESSLVLPKILCGLKPSHPVNCKRFIVDENILHQVHELISSAIEYWSVLKNTSIEGLRESFLLREGKIIEKNNDWFLIVERRPYDMLLQQLPWNISMIKLPWMSNTIITEWVY